MGVYVTQVWPRWSDMDPYGHVNHARTVTLLEEARVALVFGEAARHGVDGLRNGLLVVKLSVDYRRPLVVNGGPVRVELSVRELRASSFVVDYVVRTGRAEGDEVAAVAETLMAPYSLDGAHPRRLTDAERDFLAGWLARGDRA